MNLLLVALATAALAAVAACWLYLRQTVALKRERERTASLDALATYLQELRERERGLLARELHDELGAMLTAAKLDVARLKPRLGSPAPEVAERLQHLTETLNSGISLKRRIIEDLRPSSLANLGLAASLEILAREFSDRWGLEVTTRLDAVALDETHQLTAYRLVQEALANSARHAQARKVEIRLRGDGDSGARVCVEDDGQGFDTGRLDPAQGLASLRHRVEAAGGRFSVASMPGRGTTVSAVLPQAIRA